MLRHVENTLVQIKNNTINLVILKTKKQSAGFS